MNRRLGRLAWKHMKLLGNYNRQHKYPQSPQSTLESKANTPSIYIVLICHIHMYLQRLEWRHDVLHRLVQVGGPTHLLRNMVDCDDGHVDEDKNPNGHKNPEASCFEEMRAVALLVVVSCH